MWKDVSLHPLLAKDESVTMQWTTGFVQTNCNSHICASSDMGVAKKISLWTSPWHIQLASTRVQEFIMVHPIQERLYPVLHYHLSKTRIGELVWPQVLSCNHPCARNLSGLIPISLWVVKLGSAVELVVFCYCLFVGKDSKRSLFQCNYDGQSDQFEPANKTGRNGPATQCRVRDNGWAVWRI